MKQQDERILRTLFRHGPLSNQELASELAVSPAVISSSTAQLVKTGTVITQEATHSARTPEPGTRRKRTFQVNPNHGNTAVIEIDFDYLTIHLINFDLEPITTKRVPVARNDRDTILDTVEKELGICTSTHRTNPLCGIGFTMPGQVDIENNIAIHNTRIDNWDNVSFNRFKKFSQHIITENVANAVALGESLRGSARDVDDFLVMHIGNGAGMGIMIGGNLHRGHNFAAGEAGHVIIDESGQTTCSCGNHGCLESFVSRRAMMKELQRLRENEVPSRILSDLDSHDGDGIYRVLGMYHESGDKVTFLMMQELAHKVGLAAANFVQVLAPARVVLSGPIINLGQPFLALVEQTLRRYQLPWLDPVPVMFGQDAHLSAAQGAAMLAFQRWWRDR